MADLDTKPVAPGVIRSECGWGYYLKGTKEALIASGLAKPHWFSDGTVRNKRGYVKRKKKLTIDGREISTTTPASGPCVVWVHHTPDEAKVAEARRAADCALDEPRKRKLATNAAKFLEPIERRISGCSSLLTQAAGEIIKKIECAENPPDWVDADDARKLHDSSKLSRALDDLDLAHRNIAAVMGKLREAVGTWE